MQLYAFDREGRLIAAGQARKETNYFCMECQASVRLRGGLHRQKHFFHLQNDNRCRQNGKGMPHLLLQQFIQEAFPPGAIHLERRFPSIGRIADAVHEEHKIIFEIQCSPISSAEAEGRNRDYLSLGYRVLWILHDRQFNQKRLSEAEFYLSAAHYFTNIDEEGCGEIYDQFAYLKGVIRKRRLPKLPLDIRDVCRTEGAGPGRERWKLRIGGDHWDRCREDNGYAATQQVPQKTLWTRISRGYWLLFGAMLERASR